MFRRMFNRTSQSGRAYTKCAAALILSLAAGTAAPSYARAGYLPPPHFEGPTADQPARLEPIGGYTLALLWMPEHCHVAVPGAESLACPHPSFKRFVLHGLWPDGVGKSWPQWCRPAEILSRRTIERYYRATPSPQLLQHEWAKHGTCIPGMTPERYFAISNGLFAQIRYPEMITLAERQLDAGAFARAFASANPGIPAEAVRLNLDPAGWLREVWLCLDTGLKWHACAAPALSGRPLRIRLPD